jgi:DNA repair protein RecN (Recombination protein N)
MLQELSIRNFALIDELHLTFPAGLSLITGETGAGKSIVIDALGLVLGERVSGQDVIRTDADRCLVEAVFDLRDAPPATMAYLAEQSLIDEDSAEDSRWMSVSRELSRSGKNQCRINGQLMPVAALREATDGLIDIHGQHEHQSLLATDRHLDLLDNWLGGGALTQRTEVGRLFTETARIKSELHAIRESAKDRARNLDLYRFQKDEIESAGLRAVEEDELATEKTRLANAEKLRAYAEEAYEAVNDVALDALNSAAACVQRGGVLDPALETSEQHLNEALAAADEARRSLRRYCESIDADPARLEQIEERLDAIHSLKRKYGDSYAEILAYCEQISKSLDEIECSDERENQLSDALGHSENQLVSASSALSGIRRAGSAQFSAGIQSELRDLGMAQCRFEVIIGGQVISARGLDAVEFLIAPNPGEPLKPLAKIASGGELSRIMLALKTVLSRAAYVPTLIFDEIDIGVGGRTASTIAEKLASLACSAQVFCITHLPQIASQPAAAHFSIEKRMSAGRTTIHIQPLDADGRVDEIARMLGGTRQTETVIRHAREMLESPAEVA